MSEIIFRGGTILTMDENSTICTGDVAALDGTIVHVGGQYVPRTRDYQIVDAENCVVMPGLVQTHIHSCQTLVRGRAENLELLDWLSKVIWPAEAAHDATSLRASAELSYAELLRGGTTCVLDMATVHHTEQVFTAAQHVGIRAIIGNALMDDPSVPTGLRQSTKEAIDTALALHRDWHDRDGGRLKFALTPRFALSCTDELLRQVASLAKQHGLLVHTHSSENQAEIAQVKKTRGAENIEYLQQVGLCGSHVCIAHCVWLSPEEQSILAKTQTRVLHCPSSNLKLASGIAPIPELIAQGVSVSLGADGAPCNNNLDGFFEMRLAALLHKPRAGVTAMPASQVLAMATRGGAEALGLAGQVGTLEVGKEADVIAVNVNAAHTVPSQDPFATIVYASKSSDVKHVAVKGELLLQDFAFTRIDLSGVLAKGKEQAGKLFSRL